MKIFENRWTLGLQSGLNLNRWFKKPKQAEGVDLAKALCAQVLESQGDYSTMLLSESFFECYESLTPSEKSVLLNHLNDDFDLLLSDLQKTTSAYAENPNSDNLAQLIEDSQSRRRKLFSRLNSAPGATAKIVKLREDVLVLAKASDFELGDLEKLNLDLLFLLRDWFNRGFLELKQIDWNSPAQLLEKIIAYEAVHKLNAWKELKTRLKPEDRLCFGFFHPCMPGEPLVFLELALTRQLPTTLDQVLATQDEALDPDQANCVVFYSISNCHKGLQGVSFGNFLIKHVVAKLSENFPNLSTFATLSPIPGFGKWTENQKLSTPAPLDELATRYLTQAKNADGSPLDPVARFHLRNGASIHRLLPAANNSEAGLIQSHGMMVNYLYDVSSLAKNHEDYVRDGTIALSEQFKKQLS